MSAIIDTHAFKEAFKEARQDGFTLVRDTFIADNIKPWEMVTRKYDDQHYCIVVFEDRQAAENECAIFTKPVPYNVRSISVKEIMTYIEVMDGVCPNALIVYLRDRDGRFAILAK